MAPIARQIEMWSLSESFVTEVKASRGELGCVMSGWRGGATEMEERPEIEEVDLRSALKPGIGARDIAIVLI